MTHSLCCVICCGFEREWLACAGVAQQVLSRHALYNVLAVIAAYINDERTNAISFASPRVSSASFFGRSAGGRTVQVYVSTSR